MWFACVGVGIMYECVGTKYFVVFVRDKGSSVRLHSAETLDRACIQSGEGGKDGWTARWLAGWLAGPREMK